jgi:hypothetical protein
MFISYAVALGSPEYVAGSKFLKLQLPLTNNLGVTSPAQLFPNLCSHDLLPLSTLSYLFMEPIIAKLPDMY